MTSTYYVGNLTFNASYSQFEPNYKFIVDTILSAFGVPNYKSMLLTYFYTSSIPLANMTNTTNTTNTTHAHDIFSIDFFLKLLIPYCSKHN